MNAVRRPARPGMIRLLLLSVLVGTVGGLVGVAYLQLLAFVMRWLWPDQESRFVHWALLIGVGVLISIIFKLAGDPGETGMFINHVHVGGGPGRLRPLISLVPVSLLGIGVGGGVGPEPPLMQTTGTVGSLIGRRLALSPHELRVLTVTGMASGLTALFAAPLGAAVFALEFLHRKGLEYYDALLPACAGSLTSYGVYVLATGRGLGPVWPFPAGPLRLEPVDLLVGAVAGVGGAALAYVFGGIIWACSRLFTLMPSWLRPPAAGLALGALAFPFPFGLTFGEAHLGELSMPEVPISVLLLAAGGHLLGAAVTLAGGWRGGIIIPMFLVGYCLGRSAELWNGDTNRELVLATAMMVACNVGMTKTPLGSTLVVAQMTGVWSVPPMLIAALASLALTDGVAFVGNQRSRDVPVGPPPLPPTGTAPPR